MQGFWTLNGADLYSTYGAAILKGSYEELLSPPTPRKRLEYEYPDRSGVAVDTTTPLTFEPKRFKMNWALYAKSKAQFWQRYEALFITLAQAGSFSLYVKDLDRTFTLLYEGAKVTNKQTKIDGAGFIATLIEVSFLEPMTDVNSGQGPGIVVIEDGDMRFFGSSDLAFSFDQYTGKITIN